MENWRSDAQRSYGSKNHIMFGSVSVFFYQFLAGIRGGWGAGSILVAPEPWMVPQLTGCSAVQLLEHGKIAVSWQKYEGARWALNVTAPPSTHMITRLPMNGQTG